MLPKGLYGQRPPPLLLADRRGIFISSYVFSFPERYITTYHMYAKRGAVVTDYDSTTGSFTYIGKCEMCGETDGMVNNMGPTYGGSISASFVCKNPNCSMKGKSQPVEIGCETSGEWVEK